MEGVINIKNVPDRLAKSVVADYERGLTEQIMPYAWQSETCIGEWHYNRALFDKPGEYGGYLHSTRHDSLDDRHGQQERHVDPEHSRQARWHHRQQGDRRAGPNHRLDAGERRCDLCDPAVEDLMAKDRTW